MKLTTADKNLIRLTTINNTLTMLGKIVVTDAEIREQLCTAKADLYYFQSKIKRGGFLDADDVLRVMECVTVAQCLYMETIDELMQTYDFTPKASEDAAEGAAEGTAEGTEAGHCDEGTTCLVYGDVEAYVKDSIEAGDLEAALAALSGLGIIFVTKVD